MVHLSGIYTLYNNPVQKNRDNKFVSIDCMCRNFHYNLFAE